MFSLSHEGNGFSRVLLGASGINFKRPSYRSAPRLAVAMPRTKYTRKTKAANDTKKYDMMMQTFDRHVQSCLAKLERDAQTDIMSFKTFVDVMVSRLPMEIRQMTLGEILNCQSLDNRKEDRDNELSSSIKDHMKPPAAPRLRTASRTAKRAATAVSDDGYATEGGTSVSSTSRVATKRATSMRRTRSLTRASRMKLSEINQKTVAKSKSKDRINESSLKTNIFKTPALLKHMNNVYDVVTPKVKPNTPLNVLRRPRQGEMVLSMQGSPLLVSAVVEEKTANINVPLANGSVISLLPQEGLRMSHIPPLDSETMHQLETLKHHIEKVISTK